MRIDTRTQTRRGGFTLVELLVVLAIIGILSSIVVPNVARYISKSRITKAASEIQNAETALTGMLSDAGVSRFRDFFIDPVGTFEPIRDLSNIDQVIQAQGLYQEMFYTLLRQGSQTNLPYLNPAVVNKLGEGYMNIGLDPWGNQYRFWMGPQRLGPMPFRSYRLNPAFNDPDAPGYQPYVYDGGAKAQADSELPGNPPADNLPGFPAPRNLPAYIYSMGPNELVDGFAALSLSASLYTQDPAFLGGGDDINNWDDERGWEFAPQ